MEDLNGILVFVYFLLIGVILSYLVSIVLNIFRTRFCNKELVLLLLLIIISCLFFCGEFIYERIISFVQYIDGFVLFLILVFLCIFYKVFYPQKDIVVIIRWIRSIFISTLILLIGYLGAKIMLRKFNNGDWWFTKSTNISTNMGDWGDFATCLGTIFALVSISFAYRAFRSQTKAARRASFDATFTQIFAQHNTLRGRVVRYHRVCDIEFHEYDVFTLLSKVVFGIYQKTENEKIPEIYDIFMDRIDWPISVNLKNYFKYIYHEVSIVISQPDDILDDETKLRYIQLIQAQMNYDELICYLINQIEYISRCKKKFDENKDGLKKIRQESYNEATWYANKLREYKFFRELCKNGCEYSKYINILMKKEEGIIKELISADWVCIDEEDCYISNSFS